MYLLSHSARVTVRLREFYPGLDKPVLRMTLLICRLGIKEQSISLQCSQIRCSVILVEMSKFALRDFPFYYSWNLAVE